MSAPLARSSHCILRDLGLGTLKATLRSQEGMGPLKCSSDSSLYVNHWNFFKVQILIQQV